MRRRGSMADLIRVGNVDIHPDAEIWVNIERVSLVTRGSGRIIIGKSAFLNGGVWIRAEVMVHVGDWCKVGPRVMMMDNDAHELSVGHASPGKSAPIILEADVLVGAGSIILKGVTIGKHSVVGAGSVVTRNVPPSVLVAGNPARVVREL